MKASGALTRLVAGTALAIALSTSANADAQDSGPEMVSKGDIQDIVVTARRRSESILDVPVSVTVLSGDSLATRGVTRLEDLQNSTPGFKASPTSGRRSNSQYALRGIVSADSLITQDAPVGVYVNEVYRARATGINQSFYDIDSVQLLYGPQGTLFGRNSTAGAVLISTRKPTDRFEGEMSAGFGNFGQYQLTGIVNVPIGETLSIRLAGQRTKRDGYGENITTGQRLANINSWSGRISVLFRPTDGIENLAIFDTLVANEAGSLNILYGYTPGATFGGIAAATAAQQRAIGPYKTVGDALMVDYHNVATQFPVGTVVPTGMSNPDQYERPRTYNFSNTTIISLGDALKLKNIFSFNRMRLEALTDLDATPSKLIDTWYLTTNKQITNEIQLQGEWANFNFVAGALYFRERGRDLQNNVQTNSTRGFQNLLGINTSYGLFAQGTYKVTPKLSFTAGGRYSIDKREVSYIDPRTVSATSNICSLPAPYNVVCFAHQEKTFREPTYTVSLDYKLTRDMLFYVAHRRGYRSGGFNARVQATALTVVNPSLQSVDPENVKDVEIGFKGTFNLPNGGSIRPSIALYQAWYTDLQRSRSIITGLASPVTTSVVTNASNAVVKGLEASLGVSPVRGFTLESYFSYVDGQYKNFQVIPAGTTTPIIVASAPFAGSKYTAGVVASVTPIDTPQFGKLTWSTSYAYRSHFDDERLVPFLDRGATSPAPAFNTFEPNRSGPASRIPAQHMVNLALEWNGIMGTSFSARLWANNVMDDVQYLTAVSQLGNAFGVAVATVGEPRTYGLTLAYKFGQ